MDPEGRSLLGAVGVHPVLAAVLGLVLAFAALLCMERPKRLSPRLYAAQLRSRLKDIELRLDKRSGD